MDAIALLLPAVSIICSLTSVALEMTLDKYALSFPLMIMGASLALFAVAYSLSDCVGAR